jgi:hypothetical protein
MGVGLAKSKDLKSAWFEPVVATGMPKSRCMWPHGRPEGVVSLVARGKMMRHYVTSTAALISNRHGSDELGGANLWTMRIIPLSC